MVQLTKLLTEGEEKLAIFDALPLDVANDEYDIKWNAVDSVIEQIIDSGERPNQDEFVRFLDLVRNMSWDIPSALMAVCGHGGDGEEGIYFFMHRGSPEEHAKYLSWPALEEWEPADKHFKEVHELDLKDERINWSFDT